jgi:hypothetical protein
MLASTRRHRTTLLLFERCCVPVGVDPSPGNRRDCPGSGEHGEQVWTAGGAAWIRVARFRAPVAIRKDDLAGVDNVAWRLVDKHFTLRHVRKHSDCCLDVWL